MNKTRLILSSICAVLVIIYMAWGAFYTQHSTNDVLCEGINIYVSDSTQRQFVSVSEIKYLLNKYGVNPIGHPIQQVKSEDIENVLGKHSMIKKIICYKTPANKINIELEQRIPKLRVMNGTENYYIDRDRRKMPISNNYAAYVPVISGHISSEKACGEFFDFITFLEKNNFWNAQIEQIHVCDNQKIELVPRIGNHLILLGTLDRYEQKLNKLQKLYVNGFGVIGWKAYNTIDLQYHNQIVCKK